MDNQETPQEEARTLEFEIAPIESITKAEIDCQIATARQFPRSLNQFYKRAEAMVTVDQETAESCIYRLRRKDKNSPGGYKIIEGESVRMAEIVAANFGNLRSAVHIVGHTPTRVCVRAVCHDLETNNLIAVEKQAKTAYSDGSPYNEDMAITTANALVSKALRDAIFRVVPKALIKPLKQKAKLVAFGDGKAFIDRRRRALEWATTTRNVPAARVFAALGVKGEEDMTVEHLEILTGLKNAIMEGDQSVEEAFPPLDSEMKPIMIHPEKAKQEESAGKVEAKAETKAPVAETKAAKVESKAKKPETKAPEPEPEKKTEAAPVAAPEPPNEETKQPANVVTMPAPTEAPTPTPEPTPAQEEKDLAAAGLAPELPVEAKAPGEMTEGQKGLKAAIEAAGLGFEDLANFAAGKFLPKKTDPRFPKDYSMIDDGKASLLLRSVKGLVAGIKEAKSKKK